MRIIVASGFVLAITLVAGGPARGGDTLERPSGRKVVGTFSGDRRDGFRFAPADGSAAIPIDGPAEIDLGGEGPAATAGIPPVQVVLGLDQRVSGTLVSVDDAAVVLADGPGGRNVTIERAGVLSIRQRPGEAVAFEDGFESLAPERWAHVGEPAIDRGVKLAGEASLRLVADGSAVTAKLPEAVAEGRLEVAYRETGEVVAGSQWFVDLLFRGKGGPESIRALLGWSEESLAVQSSGGPVLTVQRLARKPGWHRLEVRFAFETAELSVDGDALAHGKGPSGPLVEVRLGTSLAGEKSVKYVAAHVDAFRLVRLAPTAASSEVDPDQDEARLIEGDQVFGKVRRADARAVVFVILGRPVTLPWSRVASLDFRRAARPSRPVEGLLARVEWRTAPGADPRDLDRAEGALVAATAEAFTLETPYAGTLTIPRDRLRRLVVESPCSFLVIDPTAHHLGDEISKAPDLLDPPQPEGGVLERTFTLAEAPDPARAAALVFDVVQVVGEANGLDFSFLIRQGELRTKVSLNGREFDYLNRHVATRNEEPERIRLPIPPGLLKAGLNTIRIVQTGKAKEPNYLDDLGVLGIALEVSGPPGKP